MSERNGQDSQHTGDFRLRIDESDMATGEYDPVKNESGGGIEDRYSPSSARANTQMTRQEKRREKRDARKRNRLKARKNKRVFKFMWVCMVFMLAITLASYLIGGSNDFLAVGRKSGTTQVTVPENPTEDELAQILYDGGAIDKPEFFSLYCKITTHMEYFSPGTYELETDMDYQDIITNLQGADDTREVVRVTFPEGVNVLEAAELLEENEVCSSEDFLDAVNSGEFGAYDMIGELTNLDERYFDLEGYLFPDTYDFYKGEELDSVVGKLLYNFQVKMSDSMMTLVEQSGMELDDVVKIASIIQAEAANEGDMFDVSTVIHNRLSIGADYGINSLECDSTVYYPYREAADIPETGALSYGAYNTYEITGLPPAPICNPGMQAIMAALTPNEGDYLYFCHSADGTPYYATTEEEHLQNLELAGLR